MRLTPLRAAELARGWASRRLRRARRPHGVVLMYHRVAEAAVDPWNLCVSPGNFREQMQVLAELAELVPLECLPTALRCGRSAAPAVAVTFDDGYVDNLTAAKPILDRFGVPATVFVITGLIGSGRPFWWDRLTGALLGSGPIPPRIELREGGLRFSWHGPEVGRPGRRGACARRRLHGALWSRLRALTDDAREDALGELSSLLGADGAADPKARPMNAEELHRLAEDGRVRIGAHTVTHPVLPGLTREEKSREIDRSAEQCRALLGRRPDRFSYPYGELDPESVGAVGAAGFLLACSSREDLVWGGQDPLQLPRIEVRDWSGEAFRRRLEWYWLP